MKNETRGLNRILWLKNMLELFEDEKNDGEQEKIEQQLIQCWDYATLQVARDTYVTEVDIGAGCVSGLASDLFCTALLPGLPTPLKSFFVSCISGIATQQVERLVTTRAAKKYDEINQDPHPQQRAEVEAPPKPDTSTSFHTFYRGSVSEQSPFLINLKARLTHSKSLTLRKFLLQEAITGKELKRDAHLLSSHIITSSLIAAALPLAQRPEGEGGAVMGAFGATARIARGMIYDSCEGKAEQAQPKMTDQKIHVEKAHAALTAKNAKYRDTLILLKRESAKLPRKTSHDSRIKWEAGFLNAFSTSEQPAAYYKQTTLTILIEASKFRTAWLQGYLAYVQATTSSEAYADLVRQSQQSQASPAARDHDFKIEVPTKASPEFNVFLKLSEAEAKEFITSKNLAPPADLPPETLAQWVNGYLWSNNLDLIKLPNREYEDLVVNYLLDKSTNKYQQAMVNGFLAHFHSTRPEQYERLLKVAQQLKAITRQSRSQMFKAAPDQKSSHDEGENWEFSDGDSDEKAQSPAKKDQGGLRQRAKFTA